MVIAAVLLSAYGPWLWEVLLSLRLRTAFFDLLHILNCVNCESIRSWTTAEYRCFFFLIYSYLLYFSLIYCNTFYSFSEKQRRKLILFSICLVYGFLYNNNVVVLSLITWSVSLASRHYYIFLFSKQLKQRIFSF